ncbi:hypothetical protein CDD81_6889 [Ophiocordyceps australis]|uniref:Uncharacterized protein n=1 Tax=Ophiocordyceps australis TaxID=1399860 RepID=A0A2C5Y6H9_9HYPO|nr:hypothetical protein CDD81_6889 [Ophiocordyceps australis]
MPAIPVYSSSPINAAKASGVSPHSSRPDGKTPGQEIPETAPAAVASHSATPTRNHLAAQPGARPSLPMQTGQPHALAAQHNIASVAATPTQQHDDASPPAPQPGAVPRPPGASRQIPPPPKASKAWTASTASEPGRSQDVPATLSEPPRMPPQMSYQPPAASLPIQGRSSTTPSSLQPNYPASDSHYSHPPGYQQNVYGANAQQHVAPEAEPGVWDTARKWASAAGQSLAAAEDQVWKRINKDL